MKKLLLFFLIVFYCFSTVWSQTNPGNDTDHQFWHETQLIFPLIKTKDDAGKTIDKLVLVFNGNLRLGTNLRGIGDKRVGFGFDYKHNKNVSFTTAYLYIAQQNARGRKQYESRLRFAANFAKGWKHFSLDDRNLVEYRFRNNNADSVRYRNRLRFVYPIKKDKKELFVPFAANEVFYEFRAKTLSRNEFSIGLTRKLNQFAAADFFYLLQTNKSGLPKKLNVFGINLKIKID